MQRRKSSFRGGIHPPYHKERTKNVPAGVGEEPKSVAIPMSLHIGAPCKPTVKRGDYVYLGQKIGEAQGFVSAPIHSSVSGTVKSVGEMPHPNGDNVMSVVIESDGQNSVDPSIKPYESYTSYSPKEIIDIIREAGIVGLGGATFPTHVKLSVPPDKNVDCVILNGAECEPYLTADDHLMQMRPDKVVKGLKIAMRAVGVDKGYIGIEDNKPAAIELLEDFICNCQKDSISIILIHSPFERKGYEKIQDHQDMLNLFRCIAERNGVPFLDYTEDPICYDTLNFYNAMHLNATGADLFSEKLAHDLDLLGLIPPR